MYWSESPRFRKSVPLVALVFAGLVIVIAGTAGYAIWQERTDEKKAQEAVLVAANESPARARAMSNRLEEWRAKLFTSGIDSALLRTDNVPPGLDAAIAAPECQFTITAPFGSDVIVGAEMRYGILLANTYVAADDYITFFGFEDTTHAKTLKSEGREKSDRAWGTRAIGKSGPLETFFPDGTHKAYGIHMTGLPAGRYPVLVHCTGYNDFVGEIELTSPEYNFVIPIELTKIEK